MLSGDEIRFDGWVLRRRTGDLVTREQLIDRLWLQGVVDFDTALNSAMRRLRTALAKDSGSPGFMRIATTPSGLSSG